MIDEYKKLLDQKAEIDKQLKQLKAKILEENKPNGQFGTFHFGEFDIVIPKKVEWDQDKLMDLACQYNFVKCKYDVNETLYKALPDEVKKDFEDSRTLKQGTPTIKIKDE